MEIAHTTWKSLVAQLRRLTGLGNNHRSAPKRQRPRTELQLEALESRWLPSLSVTFVAPLQATEGTPTPNQMLAQCSCDSGSASDYRATIDWGDGTSSVGTIANFNPGPGLGLFNVYGSHTYTQDGSFTERVSVSGQGASASGTGPVTVADAPLSVGFQSFSATEGTAFSGPVASFTDPNLTDPANAYAATINWGDGTSSAGTVTGSAGSFSVAGAHTYGSDGAVTPSVTVLDADNGLGEAGSTQGFNASGSITVADAPLSGQLQSVSATEQTAFSGTVATFTDPNPNDPASSYTTSINWGDGTIDQGVVSGAGGSFSVSGSHTYRQDRSFPLSVTIQDSDSSNLSEAGTASVTLTGSVAVADAPLSGSLVAFQATEQAAFSGTVATFTDPNPNDPANSYPVTIAWGDGSTSAGALLGSNGHFSVEGGHTYSADQTYAVTVSVQDTDTGEGETGGAALTLTGSVTVADAPLSAAFQSFSATEGAAFSGPLATFTDPNPADPAAAYTATIAWGDGASSAGTVAGSAGSFNVTGSHNYGEEGSYTPTVTIQDADLGSTESGTATAVVSGPIRVADAALSVAGASLTLVEGNPFSGLVASLSDADPNGAAGDYSASIDWGDGSTSAGTVVSDGGQFDVAGSHTYAEEGDYPLAVTIQDGTPGVGNSVTLWQLVAVNDAPLSWDPAPPSFTWSSQPHPAPSLGNPGPQTSAEGQAVTLPVQASDGDGDVLTYDAVDLPPGLSIDLASGLISGTIDYSAADYFGGAYTPTIIVADGQGGSTSQSFTWTVTDTIRSPVVTDPGNQANTQGDDVSVQVAATQPDGDALNYDATNLPPGLSIDGSTGLISGTIDPASGSAASPYSVTVTVTDQDQSASASFSWTVSAANHAPLLDALGDQENAAGDDATLQLSASDADGNALTYTATGLPAGLSIDPASGQISGTLVNAATSATPYTVTVTASDGMTSASQTFHWTVNAVGLTNPGDQDNVNGDAVSLPLTASDATGATLTYSATGLPPGLAIDSGSGLIAGTLANTADANSPYAVTVTATDGSSSASQTFTWTVAHLALANPGDRSDREGSAVALAVATTDSDGDRLAYSATGLPAGISIDPSTGAITGTIDPAAHGGSPYQVTVRASDGSHTASQAFIWTVTPRVALVSPGSQSNAAGDAVSLAVWARAPGGLLAFSAVGLPAGLSIDPGSGLISGTISLGASASSPYTVIMTASDGVSTSSQTFAWAVTPVLVAATGEQTNLDGDMVALPLNVHYHGSGSLSYSADGLPPGLSVDSGSGLISGVVSGTADTDSPYEVTVTATDGTVSARQVFTWTINPRIELTSPGDQAGAAGDIITLPIAATDAGGGTPTYAGTGLPPGLSIDSATGLISGTITVGADTSSPYTVNVTVSDAVDSTSVTFQWAVAHIALANPGPQSSADGVAVTLGCQGGDADGDALTYSAAGLPGGLSIDSNTGLIAGVIATSAHVNSPYTVTVTASDGAHSISQTFLWQVVLIGITNPGDQANTEGDAVSLLIAATDAGSGPLNYSAGGLPAGLSIDPGTGLIAGTLAAGAAASGPYTVTVAADNGTLSSSQTFTWTVNPRVTLTTPADQANVEGDSVTLPIQASEAGATLAYSADNLPAGLSIDPTTGLISGTVAAGASAAGPYTVTVTASDGTYSSSVILSWAVTHAGNTVPTLVNPGIQANAAGDGVPLALVASDANNDALTFSATGLPDGLTIDPHTGVISGTVANDAVTFGTPQVVTVTVDDSNGGTASATFDWVVNDAALTAQGVPITGMEGADTGGVVVADFTDANPNRDPADYTAVINWGDGTSDSGMVDGSDGNFTVSGEHVYEHPGRFTMSVSISDPSGGSATASSTADVAAAPLTATGGLVDDTLKEVATLETLASFTDANRDESAGSYTAQIDWGDGSATTAGIESGANGAFIVTGGHAYASDGSFTVTVTVSDSDATMVSTTSTVLVGDVYAGVQSTLNIASFTDANRNSTAADYTAVIAWGDGTQPTAAVVTGSAGTFTVLGNHAYHKEGTYTTSVTITDDGGTSLTKSSTVEVVREPITVEGSMVEATVGQPFSNAEVATFVDPNAFNLASGYSAALDWGDGTPVSSGAVDGSAGLFRVMGGHTFTEPGEYTVGVDIFWADPQKVAHAIAKVLVGALPPRFVGPGVVPGNSRYAFFFNYPTSGTRITGWDVTNVNGGRTNAAEVTTTAGISVRPDAGGNVVVGIGRYVVFANTPARVLVTVHYRVRPNGPVQTDVFPVNVVQVLVKNPDSGVPFKKGVPQDGGAGPRNIIINGVRQRNAWMKNVEGGDFALGRYGLQWWANIFLKGPDTAAGRNQGVNQIVVGFVQHAKIVRRRGSYRLRRVLYSAMEGRDYLLDQERARGVQWPYYSSVASAVVPGIQRANQASQLITAHDTPLLGVPVLLNRRPLTHITLQVDFKLDVVASTGSTRKDRGSFWTEATAAWSFNGSGSVGPLPRARWTADARVAKITAPTGWNTTIRKPMPENVHGPLIGNVDDNSFTT